MNNLTLVKLQEINNEVQELMDSPLVNESIYTQMLSNTKKAQQIIQANMAGYVDAEKMLTTCCLIEFNLLLCISQVLEYKHYVVNKQMC